MTLPERRSIRLKDFDYSKPGGYFVTICYASEKLKSINFELQKLISNMFDELGHNYTQLKFDVWVAMNNHLHFICLIIETANNTDNNKIIALGECVRKLKEKVTYTLHRSIDKTFKWQRNYYERIIRNDKELAKFRNYIVNNPLALELQHQRGRGKSRPYQI